MKTHIVLAHPEPQSFNGNLANISVQTLSRINENITFSDLYAMGFDANEGPNHYPNRQKQSIFDTASEQRFNAEKNTLPSVVKAEVQYLADCELLILHFPLWWFGMPAILKGWIDRVFVYGDVYKSTMRHDTGRFKGKKILACVTAGSSELACAPNGREGDSFLYLWPLLFPFRYIGFDVYQPVIFQGVGGSGVLENYSNEWKLALENLSIRPTLSYNNDRDFDENHQLRADAPVHSPFIRHEIDAVWK